MKIFFSSPGRRVELLKIFKKEIKNVKLIGGDHSINSPALKFCEKFYKLPYKINKNYFKEIFNICTKEKVNLIIPLIDPELNGYAKNIDLFNKNKIKILISSYETTSLFRDKFYSFNFFIKNKFYNVPHTVLLNDFNKKKFSTNFVMIKKKNGSSGNGIYKIRKNYVTEFSKIMNLNGNKYIVQEYVDFDYETTVDVFVDSRNKLIELCQRRRLKVRGGEVERAITTKNKNITKFIKKIIEKTSFVGVINIQIMTKGNKHFIGEINPRFGGGFPLSYHSGANMISHIKKLFKKNKIKPVSDKRYKNNFLMMRFDEAIYSDNLIDD